VLQHSTENDAIRRIHLATGVKDNYEESSSSSYSQQEEEDNPFSVKCDSRIIIGSKPSSMARSSIARSSIVDKLRRSLLVYEIKESEREF